MKYILASLAIIVGLGGFLLVKQVDTPLETQAYWRDQISALGPDSAYQKLKKTYRHAHFTEQHFAAHIFGEALYERIGLQGWTACDDDFAYGCYHSFFGRALSLHGPEVITKVSGDCVERLGNKAFGCSHGTGHGLLEYTGHDSLKEALSACRAFEGKFLASCAGGVFMEYNAPIVIDGGNAYTRYREMGNNPYSPCTEIPETFRKACYYEIGKWWGGIFGGNYGGMGELCGKIVQKEYETACYEGLGRTAVPESNYETRGTIEKCSRMPDKEAAYHCRLGASRAFLIRPEYASKAEEVLRAL